MMDENYQPLRLKLSFSVIITFHIYSHRVCQFRIGVFKRFAKRARLGKVEMSTIQLDVLLTNDIKFSFHSVQPSISPLTTVKKYTQSFYKMLWAA